VYLQLVDEAAEGLLVGRAQIELLRLGIGQEEVHTAADLDVQLGHARATALASTGQGDAELPNPAGARHHRPSAWIGEQLQLGVSHAFVIEEAACAAFKERRVDEL